MAIPIDHDLLSNVARAIVPGFARPGNRGGADSAPGAPRVKVSAHPDRPRRPSGTGGEKANGAP